MTAARRRAGSLRLNLMAWLIVPVAVILMLGLGLSRASAWRQAVELTDQKLLSSARIIAEQIRFRDGGMSVVVPPAALELFASDSHDEVAYSVLTAGGTMIAGFPGFGAPPPLTAGADHVTYDTLFRTEAMRAVVLRQPVITPDETVLARVVVGVTHRTRDALVRRLWLRGFAEQAALVLAAALSIWIGISRELRPLLRLRHSVESSPADSFAPLDAAGVQAEIRPLVQALNDRMARLGAFLDRQRRLLDSTAHQMRTPIAVMKTQVQVARRSGAPDEMRAVLGEVDRGLTAMSRLMTQLLTLGRAEHDRAQHSRPRSDLSAVVRQVASEMAPRALDAGIDLAVDADGPCPVAASPLLLHEVVANLIDNAVRHAGAGATATLAVSVRDGLGVLIVTDDGPGLDAAEAAAAFARFRQGSGAGPGGSGLGLAIVAEIAGMSGGAARLLPPPGGRGFALEITLPLASDQGRTAATKSLV